MMKIECNQLRDMDSGLTIPVEKIDYKPDDPRARLGVVTFTLDTGERLEFQLVKDGHRVDTLTPPEKIRFLDYRKAIFPNSKENQYLLFYHVFFPIGNRPQSICGPSFDAFMRRLPAIEKAQTQPKNEPEQVSFKTPEGALKVKVYGNLEIKHEASKGSPAIVIDNSDPKGRDPSTKKRIQYKIPNGAAWENLRTLFFNRAFSEASALPIKNPWRGLNGDYRNFIEEYARHTSGRPHKWWIETK